MAEWRLSAETILRVILTKIVIRNPPVRCNCVD